METWHVGDLAKMTGLTVRTLHHYEALGLLAPERGERGQRLYDEAAVQRLYRIRVLRDLGLTLAEIRQVVADDASLALLMRSHLERVERQVEELTRLRDRLRQMQPGAGELLLALDAMSRLERHVASRRPRGNAERWRELGVALRACMDAGEEPGAARARALAHQARALIDDFTGRDAALDEALGRVRRHAPPAELAGWDPALMGYLDRALAVKGDPGC